MDLEAIDRKVFLAMWNSGTYREAAFARTLYRGAYPNWPEMSENAIPSWLRPATNQCDGCRAGLPLRNDIHYATYANGEEYPEMYCTADRYDV